MITLDRTNSNFIVVSFTSNVKKLNILIADKFKNLIQELIDEETPNLILNLEQISYIDSSGIGTIISLYNKAKNRNINFILCKLSEQGLELVKITKLDNILNLYSDLDSAKDSII